MTMPDERTRAVLMTKQFLFDLLDHKKTPKVPGAIRETARRCLKHYPHEYDMLSAAEGAPDNFGIPSGMENK